VPLTLRPTGASSPDYTDRTDYTVFEEGRAIGRIYEDRDAPSGWRWFWSITVYVDPKLGIPTHGKSPTLEFAKERVRVNWLRCREAGRRCECPGIKRHI
jgi:hypothetical protein